MTLLLMSLIILNPRRSAARPRVVRLLTGITAFLVAALMSVTAAPPAQAVIGPCYVTRYTDYQFSAWCNGRGPDSYRVWVKCNPGGYVYDGVWRWFGDRRGSIAQCSPIYGWLVARGIDFAQ
jgi:hypothetical protein